MLPRWWQDAPWQPMQEDGPLPTLNPERGSCRALGSLWLQAPSPRGSVCVAVAVQV